MKVRVTALALTLSTLAFVATSTATAADITINTIAGTTYTTTGVTDYSVNSSQMNGMEITAYWTVNGAATSMTKAWNSGVTFNGTGFDLNIVADTYNVDAWQLDFDISGTGKLQKLVFNGVPGNTVFDRTFSNNDGTAGSSRGRDFSGFDDYDHWWYGEGNIRATYSNQVAVGNNAPVGDLWAGLAIEFLDYDGLGESTSWEFSLDTDYASTQMVNAAAAVPEPLSLSLLGTGLFGLAAARRRAARRS